MTNTVTQEDIDIFCTDAQSPKEQPPTANYESGVDVRYTAPAKWWNWFWNIITSWFTHHKADEQNLITEETNLLAAAGKTPVAADVHQMSDSFHDIAENYSEDYDEETVTEGGVEHFVNKPYVSGSIIVLPDTELL